MPVNVNLNVGQGVWIKNSIAGEGSTVAFPGL